MKIHIFTKFIITAAVLIFIWGMTPPAFSLAAKIILTLLFFFTCNVLPTVTGYFLRFSQLNYLNDNPPNKTGQLLHATSHALMFITTFFVGWIYDVDFTAVMDKTSAILSEICSLGSDDPNHDPRLLPICRIARRLDFTAVCSCISLCLAGNIFCHYGNYSAIIALICGSLFLALIFITVAYSSTTFTFSSIRTSIPTDPLIGAAASVAQVIVLSVQLLIATAPTMDAAPNSAYAPFFTIDIGAFSLDISPLWMVVIISSILFLIGCTSIGSALHGLINSTDLVES